MIMNKKIKTTLELKNIDMRPTQFRQIVKQPTHKKGSASDDDLKWEKDTLLNSNMLDE